ncbi:MAG: DUF4197 domain-containing protein [Myxococcales bacterium]|nr:DUF4197 domain-containing protein [Myxococcales bacterium]
MPTFKAARARALVTALSVTFFVGVGPAFGADWLNRGKSILEGLTGGGASGLSEGEVGSGLKEALRVGTARVVDQLGAANGFNADPVAHIPLPESLSKVQSALETVGMSSLLDDLELKMNRAAETATPQAKEIFWSAIGQLTLDDAMGIYNGPEDAATQYFKGKTSGQLRDAFRPIVESALAETGAVAAYDKTMSNYQSIPFVPDVKANLTEHVLDGGLAGIFHYLAGEEASIRQNPAARTTDLLKKVFGAK